LASTYNPHEVIPMTQVLEIRPKRGDLIEGITEGLEDFIAGRCKHFKTDEEMEAYLMNL